MPTLTDLSTIRDLCARYDFALSKGFGQNFIINPGICPRIAEASGIGPGWGALEVGPGIGVLTEQLCKRADNVVSIEVDKRLPPLLEETMAECDIFVIAEGFRDEDINLTKYSLSTKASDGLASGAAVLTYGPDDAGVVGYMKETGASMVCTDPKSLKESLSELIYNEELQENFYQKAVEITQAHHTIESSTATFEKVVERAIREFNSKRDNA